METLDSDNVQEAAHLFDISSDAIAICKPDGTVLHVNRHMLETTASERADLVGEDIKDMLYSMTFERAENHQLPFALDGSESSLMLKLLDGSFIPVKVRAGKMEAERLGVPDVSACVFVAIRNLEEQYTHDRQMQRVMAELRSVNKRLSGTLSVIMATVGAEDLPSLLDTVLNKLVTALDASGATIYFLESGGFKLRGISKGLSRSYVPEFIPYGAGIPTYVLRKACACRLTVAPAAPDDTLGTIYDLDERTSRHVRMQDMPPFSADIAVPVYFGTQFLGVMELGWTRPELPRIFDVRVLEVVCDYLSIQLVGLADSLRAQRTAELTHSLNRLREITFAAIERGDDAELRRAVVSEVAHTLSCHFCPVVYDARLKGYVLDFEGGSRVPLPDAPETLFFSTTAPAARVGAFAQSRFRAVDASRAADDLRFVRLTRVEMASRVGNWLDVHGLPCQGVYFDLGAGVHNLDAAGESAADSAEEGLVAADTDLLEHTQRFLLLRGASQEPVDDMEYDYLLRLAQDFERIERGERRKREERHIAQTLQVGMRSSLGSVPGITSDSLYSSATNSALVGGDFYTLMRLPDNQAVMILGDVSGKGVEAASMSALVKTALTAYAWEGFGPARMARSLNSMLMGFSRLETFATMFIAKIDLQARHAVYCSAGHPPTMLVHPPRANEKGTATHPAEVELLSCQSGVVGAFESMAYEAGSFSYEPGDMLFMYTDGAIEARDASGAFFGEHRLRDFLLAQADGGVEGLCARVLDCLDDFAGSELDDDIALVALRFDDDEQ